MEPATSSVLYERVMAGDLDAAILVHPMFDLPKTCAWQALRRLGPAGFLGAVTRVPVRCLLHLHQKTVRAGVRP